MPRFAPNRIWWAALPIAVVAIAAFAAWRGRVHLPITTRRSTAAPQTPAGFTEVWQSNLGEFSLNHAGVSASGSTPISGTWTRNDGVKLTFQSGSFTPTTGHLTLVYTAPPNATPGRMELDMNDDHSSFSGSLMEGEIAGTVRMNHAYDETPGDLAWPVHPSHAGQTLSGRWYQHWRSGFAGGFASISQADKRLLIHNATGQAIEVTLDAPDHLSGYSGGNPLNGAVSGDGNRIDWNYCAWERLEPDSETSQQKSRRMAEEALLGDINELTAIHTEIDDAQQEGPKHADLKAAFDETKASHKYLDAWSGWLHLDVYYPAEYVLLKAHDAENAPDTVTWQLGDSIHFLRENRALAGADLQAVGDGMQLIRSGMADWRQRKDRFFRLLDTVRKNQATQAYDSDQEGKLSGAPESARRPFLDQEAALRKEDDALKQQVTDLLSPLPFRSLRRKVDSKIRYAEFSAPSAQPGDIP